MKFYLKRLFRIIFFILIFTGNVYGFEFSNFSDMGLAFVTNLVVHETGHYTLAESANVKENSLNFLTKRNGDFFLGLSTVESIDERSKFVYKLAGEIASSYTFEFALINYRESPTTFNKALLFFSGTDFLWYTIYSLYLAPHQNSFYDPVGIIEETGINKSTLLSIVLVQSFLNSYRVFSDKDILVPYFKFDRYSASFNIRFNL